MTAEPARPDSSQSTEAPGTLLIIDDEQMIVDAIKTILEDMGHHVDGCTESNRGKEQAIAGDYDLILVDLRMPGLNGAEVTEAVMKEKPQANILIITAYPADPLARRALDAGARALIKKPFEVGKILDFLRGT